MKVGPDTAPRQMVSPVITVGVTGHRGLATPKPVARQVAEVLGVIRKAADEALAEKDNPLGAESLNIRIVSPLAEGADRLVAQIGLDLGASLQCVLPLPRAEYATDFATPASKKAFRDLLARAERVFELDGAGERDDAYLQVGRMVVRQSDILIAIWDGEGTRGKGGTAEIVAGALAGGMPVVWITPDGAPAVAISGPLSRLARHDIDTLDEAVRRLVSPPAALEEEEPATSFPKFGEDRTHRLAVPSRAFDVAVRLILWRWPLISLRPTTDRQDESRRDWAAPFEGHPEVEAACAPCLEDQIATPFSRADALANRYAGLYRSTYLANFLLSAVAVAVALYGAVFDQPLTAVGELVFIGLVITLTWQAVHRHYHERWIDYRHLAEQIRPLRYLFALGLTLPREESAHYLERERGKGGWSNWLAHRLERELGVPNVAVTPAYLRAVRGFASHAILEEQLTYHRNNVAKLAKVEHRLHKTGEWLFSLTAVGCMLHLVVHFVFWDDLPHRLALSLSHGLTFVAGVLPALGAAVLGIRNVGEFGRLEMRSRAMAAALQHMHKMFDENEPSHLSRISLSEELETLAAQMMSETADWRTLIITRRIELPS
jgi:hypothetical protein